MQAWGELSLNRGRGQDERIREMLQEIAAQVCIDVYNGSIMISVYYKFEECNVQGARLTCLFSQQVKNKP
jgi:hypothetical protein